MKFLIWIVVVAFAGLAGWLYWRSRKRRRTRLISLVALVREHATFDPVVLARVAGKVWNADLGDGDAEGADGFVAGAGIINTIIYGGRMYLINCMPRPYLDDPEAVAESIPDLRIRQNFREHQAWFSCDAMGVDGTTTEEEILDWYQHLAKLFAELLDDNCLLIYVPDTSRAYAINEETERALQSDDPLQALQETLTVPLIAVPDDDPLMKEAVEKARQAWPEFVAAFEARAGENFSVKAPVSHSGNTEFIWVSITAIEGNKIYGKLGNDPANLGPLKLGSNVHVQVEELNDWCYIDPQGNLAGGFTIAAVKEASRRHVGNAGKNQ